MKTIFVTAGIRLVLTATVLFVAVGSVAQGERTESPPWAGLTFQLYAGSGPITVRDMNGQALGKIRSLSIFEVQLPEAVILKAKTPMGIDPNAILEALPQIPSSVGPLVETTVPIEAAKTDGTTIAPGTRVWVKAEEFSAKGRLRVSSMRGDNPEKAEGFNKALQDNGIVGVRDRVVANGKHSHPRVPLTAENHDSSYEGERFLTSPTCSCARGACTTTSYFGNRGSFKVSNGRNASTYHAGIDIGGGDGTPIIASADGCVSRKLTYRQGGYGLSLYLDHGKGFTTQYSHLRGFVPEARVGQCFKRGDTIGYMGATGNCTGPHLHFGVYKEGRAVDPRSHLASRADGTLSRQCSSLRAEFRQLEESKPGEAASPIGAVASAKID